MRIFAAVLAISTLAACDNSPPGSLDGGGGGGGTGAAGGGSGGGSGGGTDAGGGAGGGSGGGGGTGGGTDGGSVTPGIPYVYVGSGNGTVSVFRLDRATGALTLQGSIDAGPNPSFLAVDPAKRFLYAVNEGGAGNSFIASFDINPSTGLLTQINRQSSQGNGPAHVSVDQTGRWVFGANYGGGTVAVFPVRADGGLSPASHTQAPGATAHQIQADSTNKYVLVPCLNLNRVVQYLFDADAGTLTANPVPFFGTDAGAGPRHLSFHPSGKFAYLINETNSTLQALSFDGTTGRLAGLQTVSTLPAGFAGTNTTAEVVVHPNGRFVYGSNRGHNSIAAFAVTPSTGLLTLVGHTPTGGNTPRNFTIDPTGALLLAANQNSNNVVSFRIDADAGTLSGLGQSRTVNAPAFVGVVELP